MEDFQTKINLMKKKIDNIRSDIESIRGDESGGHKTTFINNNTIQHITSHNKTTTNAEYVGHNKDEYHSNEPSAQNCYKKYLFIPRSKTTQNTIAGEDTTVNVSKQVPQSKIKYNTNTNNNSNSNSKSVVHNNNNSNSTNSIVYNFDYRINHKSLEYNYPNNHKHNSQHNSSRKHNNNHNSHHHRQHSISNYPKHEDSDCYILNKTDLFRRKMPIPSSNNNTNSNKVNSIDDINSYTLNPERVFSPIHESAKHNSSSKHMYTKVNNNYQLHHQRNKTSDCSMNRTRVFVANSTRNSNQMRSTINHEQILRELIDISNEYYGDDNENITPVFVVENYKRLLRENKTQNEFISRLKKLYHQNTNTNTNAGVNSSNKHKHNDNVIVDLWKWINHLIRNNKSKPNVNNINTLLLNNNNTSNTSKPNEYQQYCEKIMKEYGLKTMHDFSVFIDKLLKKSNKNDNFLEGIKKILLVENKIEEYTK